jgi:hypothetical protein
VTQRLQRAVIVAAWLLAAASLTTALVSVAGGAGSGATQTELGSPTAAVPTPDGGFLVTDIAKCRVSKVKSGTITPVAGDGDCVAGRSGPVSCQSATICAVGYGEDGFAFTANPTAATPSWAITKGIVEGDSPIEGLSCASTQLCLINDKAGNVYTSTAPTAGKSSWHARQVTGARAGDAHGTVACPTTTLCVLVDKDGNLQVSTNPGDNSGAGAGSGATWTPVTVPGASFWGVNCKSATLCVAFGGQTAGPPGIAVATTATPTTAGAWKVSGPASGSGFFYGASCATTSLCVAAGPGTNTLSATSNQSDASPTWGSGSISSAIFYGVSCASASLCAAMTFHGDVYASTTPGILTQASWPAVATSDQQMAGKGGEFFCGAEGHRCNIACPTAALCMASGDLGTLFSSNPMGGEAAWSQREPGDGGPATSLSLEGPGDAVPTADGGFLVQEGGFPTFGTGPRSDVRKVSSTNGGTMTRVAGTGTQGNTGDNGPAPRAEVSTTSVVPYNAPGQAVTSPGTGFLVADTINCVVRKVDGGSITRKAGTGICGHDGDGGSATAAKLYRPISAVPTPDGGFLVAEYGALTFIETGGSAIRKVDPDGKIHTVAGNNTPGYSGDGGPATSAQLNQPTSAVPTADGGFLVADWGNNVVRKVDSAGKISTVAGSGEVGQGGDGASAKTAELVGPTAAVPTPDGGFLLGSYSATKTDLAVRKVTATGVIGTVAGVNPEGKPPPDPKPQPKPKPKCVFKTAKLKVVKKKPKIKVTLTCDRAATAKVGGKVKRTIKQKGKPTKTKTYKLKAKSASAAAAKVVTVTLGLPKGAVEGLKKGDKESAALTLTGTNANGAGPTATRTIKKLKLPKPPAR